MKTKADPYTRTSFGRFLQKTRIEKNIRLSDIAQQTRIRTHILSAIEKEEHEHLPAESFLKGLLRSFAKAVGADEAEVLRLYQQDRQAFDELNQLQSRLDRSKRGVWLKLLCALGLLVVLAAASIYTMSLISRKMAVNMVSIEAGQGFEQNNNHPSSHPAKGLDTDSPDGAIGQRSDNTPEMESTPGQEKGQQPNAADSAIRMDGYLLSILAIKNTWIKVIADDKGAVKYRLKTGDRLDLTAASRFNMLIGDADGVRLTLNGRPVMVSGKSGQIVNIEIP